MIAAKRAHSAFDSIDQSSDFGPDLSAGTLAGVLREAENQSVAIGYDQLALLVNAGLWAVNDFSTSCEQIDRKFVDADDLEVRIIGAVGPARPHHRIGRRD